MFTIVQRFSHLPLFLIDTVDEITIAKYWCRFNRFGPLLIKSVGCILLLYFCHRVNALFSAEKRETTATDQPWTVHCIVTVFHSFRFPIPNSKSLHSALCLCTVKSEIALYCTNSFKIALRIRYILLCKQREDHSNVVGIGETALANHKFKHGQ